jgi:hypothetical protein
MSEQRIYAVPEPLYLELPSSWLPRVAMSQGASLTEVKRLLGFSQKKEVDLSFLGMQADAVAAMCGLKAGVFDEAVRVLRLALSLDMRHPVLFYAEERPRYRFCVECLYGMRTPYFPLYWRFDAYRMCSQHQCLMEGHCPHCGATVCLQWGRATPGKMRRSHTFSSQCFQCSKFLWDMIPLKVNAIPERLFIKHEKMSLANGVAFIAALLQGEVSVPNSDGINPSIVLPRIERMGMFASGTKSRAAYLRKKMPAKYWKSMQKAYFR